MQPKYRSTAIFLSPCLQKEGIGTDHKVIVKLADKELQFILRLT